MSPFISKMTGSGLFTDRHQHLPFPLPSLSSSSTPSNPLPFRSRRRSIHVVCARKGLSSHTGQLEKGGKKGTATTTTWEEEEAAAAAAALEGVAGGEGASSSVAAFLVVGGGGVERLAAPSLPMPEMRGEEPDFWEGPQWNAFGFFIRY